MAKIPIMAIAIMGKLPVSEECSGVLKSEFSGLVMGEREPWITGSMDEEEEDLFVGWD